MVDLVATAQKVAEKFARSATELITEIGITDKKELEDLQTDLILALQAGGDHFTEGLKKEKEHLKDVCDAKLQLVFEKQQQINDVDLSICIAQVDPPYRAMNETLDDALSTINKAYAQRRLRFEAAAEQVLTLRKQLGEPEAALPSDLTLESIYRVESYLPDLRKLYNLRVEHVQGLVKDMIDIWTVLGAPEDLVDSELVRSHKDDPSTLVTPAKIEELAGRLRDLKTFRESKVEDKEKLIKQCRSLYQELEIPEEEWKTCITQDCGLDKKAFEEIEAIIELLRAERLRQIPQIIMTTRRKIESIWEKLAYSDEQKKRFLPAYTEEFTDSSLAIHQDELVRLEERVEEASPILTAYNDFNSVKKLEEELNELAKDTKRFGKRGFNPVREERMRNTVQRRKPALIETLKTALAAWEANHEQFTVYGEPLSKLIEQEETQLITKAARRVSGGPISQPSAPAPVKAAPQRSITKPSAAPKRRAPPARGTQSVKQPSPIKKKARSEASNYPRPAMKSKSVGSQASTNSANKENLVSRPNSGKSSKALAPKLKQQVVPLSPSKSSRPPMSSPVRSTVPHKMAIRPASTGSPTKSQSQGSGTASKASSYEKWRLAAIANLKKQQLSTLGDE